MDITHHNHIDSVKISLAFSSSFISQTNSILLLFISANSNNFFILLRCCRTPKIIALVSSFALSHSIFCFYSIRSDFNDVLSLCSLGLDFGICFFFRLSQPIQVAFKEYVFTNRNGNKTELHSILICYLLVV